MSNLQNNFVYLDEIDNRIIVDIRYAGDLNFVGEKIRGYEVNRAIMLKPMAQCLSKVQDLLLEDGFSLVIYDAYRPTTAVEHFVDWANDTANQSMKKDFYQFINKEDVFSLGFISKRSAHSRGIAVDLTIIPKERALYPIAYIKKISRKLNDGREVIFIDDNTLDMGSHFDLFDPASYHDTDLISKTHSDNRNYLKNIMVANGFVPYSKEWWHYSLKDPINETIFFDFAVK
jgi:D-alanyl-D-alanine dipeptidase